MYVCIYLLVFLKYIQNLNMPHMCLTGIYTLIHMESEEKKGRKKIHTYHMCVYICIRIDMYILHVYVYYVYIYIYIVESLPQVLKYIYIHTHTYHTIILHYHYIQLHTITYNYIPLHYIIYILYILYIYILYYIYIHHIKSNQIKSHHITSHYIHTMHMYACALPPHHGSTGSLFCFVDSTFSFVAILYASNHCHE